MGLDFLLSNPLLFCYNDEQSVEGKKTITLALTWYSKGFIKNYLHSWSKEASEKPGVFPHAPPNYFSRQHTNILFFVIHLPMHVIHINHHSRRPVSTEV